jgi:hypothetical protein
MFFVFKNIFAKLKSVKNLNLYQTFEEENFDLYQAEYFQ